MKIQLSRITLPALILAIAGALLAGCVVAPGYGYGYGGYSADYYEPYGGIYGEWGPGYAIGPYRDGGRWRGHDGGSHPYRSAPASHTMPSIPSGGSGRGRRR